MNKLPQEVEGILSEAVGDFIAHATVKKNCEFIGTKSCPGKTGQGLKW